MSANRREFIKSTRRKFIKQLGIVLGSVTVTLCAPFLGKDGSARARLRGCWRGLEQLKDQRRQYPGPDDREGDRLKAGHRAALDDLVAEGELNAAVAQHVQSIFEAAVTHARRPPDMTCYLMPVALPVVPILRTQLLKQIEILNEMASSGDLDPETVAQARAAIEREMMLLSPSGKVDRDVPTEVAEAAAFLVELLSGP